MTDEAPPHPNDMPEAELARAFSDAHRPDLLRELVATSRGAFGFFTQHFAHTINYTWLLERLEALPAESRVLEVGAGVSPVPLVLARRGVHVDCIDGSSTIRRLPVGPKWNEWGYFDYAVLDPRIGSFNCLCRDFEPTALYDRIYSVSVLAHMSSAERNEALGLMCSWLRKGGRMLHAVDVIPTSDFLWNRSRGREIETPEAHGLVSDLVDRLNGLGLRMTERSVLRGVHNSRTDLLFVEAVLPR